MDFNKIREAVEKRDEYLKEHPELQPLQDEINKLLKDAGNNVHNRQVAIQTAMLNTWYKIIDAWEK